MCGEIQRKGHLWGEEVVATLKVEMEMRTGKRRKLPQLLSIVCLPQLLLVQSLSLV